MTDNQSVLVRFIGKTIAFTLVGGFLITGKVLDLLDDPKGTVFVVETEQGVIYLNMGVVAHWQE